jgi:hypothetical protein
MLSTKIRTILVSTAAIVAVCAPGVVAATTPLQRPGTITPARVAQPAKAIASIKEAGSAGGRGFDDARCEGLVNDLDSAARGYSNAKAQGDEGLATAYSEYSDSVERELEDNCLVVYN